MSDGYIYECYECEDRFFVEKKMISVEKAPCPTCGVCDLRLEESKFSGLKSEKTAKDMFKQVQIYNGQ